MILGQLLQSLASPMSPYPGQLERTPVIRHQTQRWILRSGGVPVSRNPSSVGPPIYSALSTSGGQEEQEGYPGSPSEAEVRPLPPHPTLAPTPTCPEHERLPIPLPVSSGDAVLHVTRERIHEAAITLSLTSGLWAVCCMR